MLTRKDNNRITLKKGETQDKNGRYVYRYTLPDGRRKAIYARTLKELREKEKRIAINFYEGLRTDGDSLTVNDMYDKWYELKRGIKSNTRGNYAYMYNRYVRPSFGKLHITKLVKSDVKRFYNELVEKKGLSASTMDTIQNVLHQVFRMAVDDGYIRNNITDEMLKELKKSHDLQSKPREALTLEQQEIFVDYLKNNPKYARWYPIFAVMLGTGMRIGEVLGLRWCDIDLENELISVNHTLVHFSKNNNTGCKFAINTPKTAKSNREIPMFKAVKDAFLQEREYQNQENVHCKAKVDGYTDFIFFNYDGEAQHNGNINKAIKKITRDCNEEILRNHVGTDEPVLLPNFSCHSLRHTFATRLYEKDVNVKTTQEILGHADITMTLQIYTNVTLAHKKKTFENLEDKFVGLL